MNLLSYNLFFLGIIGAVLQGVLSRSKKDFIEITVESISINIIIISFVSLTLVLCKAYNTSLALFISSALSLLYVAVYYYRHIFKQTIKYKIFLSKASLIVLCFILIMLPFIFQRYEYIEMTGDAGVYSVSAMHLIEEGQLDGNIKVRDMLSDDNKLLFDKDNLLYGGKGNLYLPGTYLSEQNRSQYYFQFYPPWPIMIATWSEMFGVQNGHYVMIVFYILSVFLAYYIFRYLGISQINSIISMILLGTSPVTIHFSKYPTSEIFMLFLILFSFYLVVQKTYLKNLWAGIVITLFCLTHISAFMYFPLLFLFFPYVFYKNEYEIAPFLLISFTGFLISIPYGYYVSYQYFLDIYSSSFKGFFPQNPALMAVIIIVSLALVGISLSIRSLIKLHCSRNKIYGGQGPL